MTDVIVVAVILVIVAAAAAYIIKAKRSGVKCVGCPAGSTCNGACQSCSGRASQSE